MSKYKCPRCGGNMKRDSRTPAGKRRWSCTPYVNGKRVYCYSTTDPAAPERTQRGDTTARAALPRQSLASQRYVITWAQNATPVHSEFLACLQTFCKHNNAQLLVIPGRYKNPTSQWTASQANEEEWAPEIAPYLIAQRRKLNDNISIVGDLKIQPTAVTPLTGFEGLTGAESAVIGHPKLQLKTVATPSNKMAKLLTTTGAVTVRNYTDSRAGKGGDFHHYFGAALVEIVNSKVFHLHQLSYAPHAHGFIHRDLAYFAHGVKKAPPYKALVFGDAHAQFADAQVVAATFGKSGLVELLDPEVQVFHDLLDAYAVNPHHFGNPFTAIAKRQCSFDDIKAEVEHTISKLVEWSAGRRSVVVASNHDNMLARWIMNSDWRRDPVNAAFYLETALHMVKSVTMTKHGASYIDPFQFHVEALVPKSANIACLGRDQSFVVGGIELSLHGDQGPKGARGSVKNLSRIGTRLMTGHGHSPAIEEGHWRVGTMTPVKLEYTGPVGDWLQTHGSIDAFNKRHLHTCIEGSFYL